MKTLRLRRSLTALRKRVSRSLRCQAGLPGRYDRALLFGGGLVLTVSILAAAATGIAHRFERCLDDWRAAFLAQRDFVNASVERNQARLRHMVETYEALAHVHARDPVPAERYRELLDAGGGLVDTEEDIGAAPFSILSTLTAPADRNRLAALLRLVREVSPSSLLRLQGAADDIGGFLYTEDRRFLAVWPPLEERARKQAGHAGVTPLIDRYVARVDAELHKHEDTNLRHERVFWVALYESDTYGTLVKHYAAPIYRGDERIAVLVVTVPATQIPRLFQPAVHDPDFFMVSRDRRHLLGIDESNPRRGHWADALAAKPSVLDSADERVRLVRRGGDFFMIQRIPGPGWVAVSAFDWHTIVANMREPAVWTIALAALLLAVQWGFVLTIDRLVLAPLRARARSVFESEAFGRTVLATAPVGLTVFEPATRRIVMQNDIARGLLAALPDEPQFFQSLLGKRAPGRRARRRGARFGHATVPGGTARTVEVSVAGTDGRSRELSVALSRARYREREVLLCSLTDISRQKETVRLLRRARNAADQASRAKSMLIATISHEIRTPLYGALGNLELLSMEELAPAQAARLTSVRHAFEGLLALVDDVLDLSKAEAHELQLHVEPFDLVQVLERCAQTLAPSATNKGLRFSCLLDPAIDGHWHGDAQRIMQVVTNLLGNACKFTDRGAVTLCATMGCATADAQEVLISVADSGIGIAAHQRERIFEPFIQADGSIARRFGGTGLGLSLSRRLVDLMGGRIVLESEEGRGATFSVYLPFKRAAPAPLHEPSNPVDRFVFDEIVVACNDAAWQDALVARLRALCGPVVAVVPDTRVCEPTSGRGRSIIVFGSHENVVPRAWRSRCSAYLDAIVVSERGPLHPQRADDSLHVTALSAAMLALALEQCGRREPLPASEGVCRPARLPREAHRATRILVAEDDPVSRTLLAHQLEALGYRHVELTCDGRQALAECLRQPYDLVLADLCMPLMDGRSLLAALRGKGLTMPVIAHTAAPRDPDEAKRSGFARLLPKPLALETLRLALDAVLDHRPASDELRSMPSEALLAVFATTWIEDEQRLVQATRAADARRVLQMLHRVKGALLTLGEREEAACCDELRDLIEADGIAAATEALGRFRERVGAIATQGTEGAHVQRSSDA